MTRFGKLPILVLLLALAAVAAAVFGALQNQLSYSVGSSYFEAMKFPQHDIEPGTPPRIGAAIVGMEEGWWVGLMIAFPAFLYGFLAVPRTGTYLAAGLGAIGLVFGLATLAALLGLVGGIVADATGVLDPFLTIPDGPVRSDFLRAGFMNDSGLVASGLGLLVAFWPMTRARRIDNARLAGGGVA